MSSSSCDACAGAVEFDVVCPAGESLTATAIGVAANPSAETSSRLVSQERTWSLNAPPRPGGSSRRKNRQVAPPAEHRSQVHPLTARSPAWIAPPAPQETPWRRELVRGQSAGQRLGRSRAPRSRL